MKKRIIDYVQNIIVNGMVLSALYFFIIWLFIPSSFYFEYANIDYQGRDGGELNFISYIDYNNSSDGFAWNDVLRCDDGRGYFAYLSSYDTSAVTSKIEIEPYQTAWAYRSNIKLGRECQMNSTVTKYIHGFIPKRQFIQSGVFLIN